MNARQKEDWQCRLVGILFLSGIIAMFLSIGCCCIKRDKDPAYIEHRRYTVREYNRTHPQPGQARRIAGQKVVIIRKCWFGENRYEARMEDGSITYVTGKELKEN